jgi:hypothetical protein
MALLLCLHPVTCHAADPGNPDLIAIGYVNSTPTDPMTGNNRTWRVAMEDPVKIVNRDEPNIFDVHSGSDGVSPGGTRYADW